MASACCTQNLGKHGTHRKSQNGIEGSLIALTLHKSVSGVTSHNADARACAILRRDSSMPVKLTQDSRFGCHPYHARAALLPASPSATIAHSALHSRTRPQKCRS
jgi:hypothetical protein